MPPGELVGMEEIATLLSVAKITAKRYAARVDFPEPTATLAGGRVWRRDDVERWARETLPLQTGRPRKRAPGS